MFNLCMAKCQDKTAHLYFVLLVRLQFNNDIGLSETIKSNEIPGHIRESPVQKLKLLFGCRREVPVKPDQHTCLSE